MQRPKPGEEEEVKITRDEYKKIERALKKPEFMGLMNDYMLEISDPKNREEYDLYLQQLQRERELPKGSRLVRPLPEFCVKTSLISQSNKRHQMKIFLNFCSCHDLERPTCAPSDRGHCWQLPHSVNKIRYDQDKEGNVCNTADVAFHPEAIELCQMPAFQRMLIQAGIEGVCKQLGERKESLSLDYVVMKNLKCKGGEPALMVMRFSEDGKALLSGQTPEERGREGQQTKLQKEIEKQRQEAKPPAIEPEEQVFDDLEQSAPMVTGVQRPRYKTIYSYPVEYGDFIEERANAPKHPNKLNIDFEVPRVESVQELQFEMSEELIRLEAKEKYFLELRIEELKLKYKLVFAEAKSKFDKKKKKLRLIVPLDLSALPPTPKPVLPDLPIEKDQPAPRSARGQDSPAVAQESQKAEPAQEASSAIEESAAVQTVEEEEKIEEEKLWQSGNKLLQISQPKTVSTVVTQLAEETPSEPAKALIEELDEDDAAIAPAAPVQPLKKSVKFEQLKYHFQENREKAMLIVNLPKYDKEKVVLTLGKQEVFVEYKQEPSLFLWAQVRQAFRLEQSRLSLIKDFIIINLAKAELDKFWEKESVRPKEASYQEFQQARDLALAAFEEEARQRREEERKAEEQRTESLRVLAEEEQRREEERMRKLQQLKAKLQQQGSGKEYSVQFIDFSKVQTLWQLD